MDESKNTRMTTQDKKLDLAMSILKEGSWKHNDDMIVVPEAGKAWEDYCEVLINKVHLKLDCTLYLWFSGVILHLVFPFFFNSNAIVQLKWEGSMQIP